MKTIKTALVASAAAASFIAADVHAATEWNVSLWGKRRAFTENVEKLAELVEAKTDGEFTLNISYGGLSKARENLDGISESWHGNGQLEARAEFDNGELIEIIEQYDINGNPTNFDINGNPNN